MQYSKIEIQEIIKGKYTYPNWSTSTSYALKCKEVNDRIVCVYYITKSNKKVSRNFPKNIILTPKLTFILGLIKGEGANALGKSNYRRFTFTNSDWELIDNVLNLLDENKFFLKEKLPGRSLQLIHFIGKEKEVIDFWSKKLKLPRSKFKCFNDKRKTTKYGVCHIYISDVLLRRIIDLIIETILIKNP
jgi:hypothetical protein